MKTVFVTLFQGVEAKNLLRTGVVRYLLAGDDTEVVLLVTSESRKEHYAKEFSDPRLRYEVVRWQPRGFWERLLARLKFFTLKTATTDLRRRMIWERRERAVGYRIGKRINGWLARPRVRAWLRRIDERFARDHTFAPLFERYQPRAVLAAHLFDDAENALVREAKRRRVPVIGFINSWDKLTARSALRLLPDTLLVFNAIVRDEAIQYADMPAERIAIAGIPQYDRYVGYRPTFRSDFLKKIGLAPNERFVLYAPMGEAFSTSDWDIIDLLHRWETNGSFGPEVKLFVRFQPNDTFAKQEMERRPWLRYDRPGTRFSAARGVDWDMGEDELTHLADTLAHMEMLICYASSMSVDAACFDKPIINIDFEMHVNERLLKSPTQFYQMAHYKNALATGAIRMPKSPDELLGMIQAYLADPAQDREARSRLVAEQCGPFDGHAAERLAAAILRAAK
ncbi:hypothetical protein C4552_02765 [Candidatus Parcubacteria bacterium]|nr:MAG: hypothetical protein C4552_02765 [Candidatus Parcubacteria bacterium]